MVFEGASFVAATPVEREIRSKTVAADSTEAIISRTLLGYGTRRHGLWYQSAATGGGDPTNGSFFEIHPNPNPNAHTTQGTTLNRAVRVLSSSQLGSCEQGRTGPFSSQLGSVGVIRLLEAGTRSVAQLSSIRDLYLPLPSGTSK